MKLNDFLKPERRKILTLAAIFVIYITFIFLKPIILTSLGDTPPVGTVVKVPDTIIDYIIRAPFFVVVGIFNAFEMSPFPMPSSTMNIIVLLNILWWYLLSCIIVFAYDKFKSRK